jgi:hypothetical protein
MDSGIAWIFSACFLAVTMIVTSVSSVLPVVAEEFAASVCAAAE